MTKKETREKRVDDILLAAVAEFQEKGYEGASVDAIAKRAGVSKGGIYHHFSTKEAILLAANDKLSEPVTEMAGRALENPSALGGLSGYIREYLNHWGSHPMELGFVLLSLSKALGTASLQSYYRNYVQSYSRFLSGLFLKAIRQGESEITDPEAYGISLMGALDGLVSYAIATPEQDMAVLASRLDAIWIEGARKRSL